MAAQRFDERAIWIDATGIVRWGSQPFSGVQRVEYSVVRFAMDQPDAGIAVMDRASGTFRPASKRVLTYIETIGRSQAQPPHARSHMGLRETLRFFDFRLRYSDNESERQMAAELSGDRSRRGLVFKSVKYGLRMASWVIAGFEFFSNLPVRAARSLARKPVTKKPLLLVSHKVNRHPWIKQNLEEAGLRGANIVYDLIPVLAPQFTNAGYTHGMAKFFRRVLTTPEPIIAISKATRDDLLQWNRQNVGADYPFDVAVCQLNATFIQTDGAEQPIEKLDGRSFALYCSTMDIRKSTDVLVAAWRRLAEKIGNDRLPDLVLIGRRGTGWAALQEELAKAAPIADKIHVLHGVEDTQLRWAYRHATLALFPSRAEGWGLGVSEALAFGLPVVHSDIAVLREAAQDLMPSAAPGDVDAWVDVLAALFTQPAQIEALRRIARDRYKAGMADDFPKRVFAYLRSLGDETARQGGARDSANHAATLAARKVRRP